MSHLSDQQCDRAGLGFTQELLNVLSTQTRYASDKPFHYEINETYSVPFVGTVVSGIMMTGVIHVGDKVLIGPDSTGHFSVTTIKGIRNNFV